MNPHRQHAADLQSMAKSLLANRKLIFQLTRREVIGRYRGSILGLAWSFFNPFLMLAVYTFVFAVVFKARWGEVQSSKAEFAIVLFVGLMMHGILSECLNRAPSLIVSNASYVKKVVFPLEILVWVVLGAALFHALISLAVLLAVQVLVEGGVPLTAIFLPFVIFPLLLITVGLAWLVSAIGVFVRDIAQIVLLLTTVMLFMAPVFYPIGALPPSFRNWLYLNPLTFIIEQARDVLIWGRHPDWMALFVFTLLSLLVAWAGFYCFQRMRKGFADVL